MFETAFRSGGGIGHGSRKVLLLVAAMVSAAAFLGLAAVAGPGAEVRDFDLRAQQIARDTRSPAATIAMFALSVLGTKTVLYSLAVGVGIALARTGSRRRLWLFVIAFAGGSALTMLLKLHFRRPRPSDEPSMWTSTGYSFPSGHATDSMLFFGALAAVALSSRRLPGPVRLLVASSCVGAALLIGWSRVYLGVHYLSDVLAGFCVATFWLTASVAVADALGGRGASPSGRRPAPRRHAP